MINCFMRILFCFLNLLIITSCRSSLVAERTEKQPIENVKIENDSVIKLRNEIANFNEVQGSNIGYSGSPSEQYGNYEALLKIASDEELIELTKDTNYVVATYASFGLIERENPYFIEAFSRFLKNDQRVNVMYGCSEGEDLVSKQLYYNYYNKVKFENYEDMENLQNDAYLLKLDSLILTLENPVWSYGKQIYENRIYDKIYLSLIESQAFEKENIYAIEYLYKNNENQYKYQIIEVLKNFLKIEHIGLSDYYLIYEILLSFKFDELNNLLRDELIDIQKEYGEEEMENFKIILFDKN